MDFSICPGGDLKIFNLVWGGQVFRTKNILHSIQLKIHQRTLGHRVQDQPWSSKPFIANLKGPQARHTKIVNLGEIPGGDISFLNYKYLPSPKTYGTNTLLV